MFGHAGKFRVTAIPRRPSMIARGARSIQPAMKFFNHARSIRSCTRAAFEMKVTRLRARRIHPDASARGPAMHHGVGHIRVKLEAERMTVLIRLHRKVVAFGEQFCAMRQLKSFAVPVVDTLRPVRAQRVAGLPSGGSDSSRPPPGLRDAARPARPIVWQASARPGRCRETAAARAGEFRSSRSRGGHSHRNRWRSSGRRRSPRRHADRASPAGDRRTADGGCRGDGRAPAARCRPVPASTSPGGARSEPAEGAASRAQPAPCWPGKGRMLSPFFLDRNDIDVALAAQTETIPK